MTTKIVYAYNPLTFEYLGLTEAQESPLETDVFLMPANATDIKPPSIEKNTIAIFLDSNWKIVPDFRGQTWYDQTTKAPIEITDVGAPPVELASTLPPLTLLELRDIKIAALVSAYNTAITSDIEFNGNIFKTNVNFKTELTDNITGSNGVIPANFYKLNAKGEKVIVPDVLYLRGISNKLFLRDWAAFDQLQTRKLMVSDAKTAADIAAVIW